MSSKINKVSKQNTTNKSLDGKSVAKNKALKTEDGVSIKKYKEVDTDPKKPIKISKLQIEATNSPRNKSVVIKPLSTPRPVIKSKDAAKNAQPYGTVASTNSKINKEGRSIQSSDIKKKILTNLSSRKAEVQSKSEAKPKIVTNVTVNSPKRKKVSPERILEKSDFPKKSTSSDQDVAAIGHKRYPTRTLETEEIKVLDKNKFIEISGDHRIVKETPPAQAKAFFVSLEENTRNPKQNVSQDTNSDSYEDDFESYESDFESYNSSESDEKQCDLSENVSEKDETESKLKSEDEKKFDSGNYELGETSKTNEVLVEKIIINERKTIQDTISHTSLTDEGFDENSLGSSLIQTFNKTDNQKRNVVVTKKNNSFQRFSDLKELITLDEVRYSLFEMYPMDYDTFISIYGKSNMNQVQCQTNDDNTDADIQTDLIPSSNKWTQYPVDCSGYIFTSDKYTKINYGHIKDIGRSEEYKFKKLNPLESYVNQRYGSGSNDFVTQLEIEKKMHNIKNIEKFSKFVNETGNFIIQYLSEQKSFETNHKGEQTKLKILDEVLKNRPIEKLLSVDNHKNIFLTLHPALNKIIDETDADAEEHSLKTFICVWMLQSNLIEPMKILITSDKVSFCSLNGGLTGLAVAGLSNGNICAWDLNESEIWHINKKMNDSEVLNNNEEKSIMVLRKCSFHSSMITSKWNDWGSVIDITFVENSKSDNSDQFSDNTSDTNSLQVMTLQEFGIITIWTVINKLGDVDRITNVSAFESCDSYWARISFFKSKVINLNNEIKNESIHKIQDQAYEENVKEYTKEDSDALYNKSRLEDRKGIVRAFVDDTDIFDIELDDGNQKKITKTSKAECNRIFQLFIICRSLKYFPAANSLLIIFNSSNIINYSLSGINMKNNIFCCDDEGSCFTSIEVCPFKLPYFLVSCGNSIIHLYSIKNEKPIKNFILNERDSKLNSDKQIIGEKNVSAVMKLQTVQSERWYGKTNLYWLLENPYNFISYHENIGIVLWDLMYSDLSPKTFVYKCNNSTSEDKLLNIAYLEDMKQIQRNIMVLHTNKGFIKMYELDNRANVKMSNGDEDRSFLITYFETL